MKVRMITMMSMLAMALCPPTAIGQVFFDDFNGDALLPHWFQPPASSWEYNVSEGMLNVTGLFSPSNPKSDSNYAFMGALFTPLSDFQMDVWMGWEAGDQPHRLEVRVGGPFGGNPIIASMGYQHQDWAGPDPLIFAGPGNAPPLTIAAPDPGIHHFTISRIGSQFKFFFNGSLMATFQDNFGTPAAAVSFFFLGPYPGELGAFHIDKVLVVPAPGALCMLCAGAFAWRQRRRR